MPLGAWELAAILFMIGLPVILGVIFAIVVFRRSQAIQRDAARESADTLNREDERDARSDIDAAGFNEQRQRPFDAPKT
jgi:uncharacterized membrane protein